MFFPTKQIVSSVTRLKNLKRFLNFWEVNLQKRRRNICFPTRSFPPFYLVILKSVLYFCFSNVLFVTDFWNKYPTNDEAGVRQNMDIDRQEMDRNFIMGIRNATWSKITYFVIVFKN